MKYFELPQNIKQQLNNLETPFFLFDLDVINRNFEKIQTTLAPDRIYYAVKCNSHPQVLDTLYENGCCFEVNNMAELQKAVNCGARPDALINSSPITPAEDVAAMHGKGVRHFVFDSKEHVDNLCRNAPASEVILRIYSTNKGSEFELSKRLGADVADAMDLLQYAKSRGLAPIGLTFHVGSQCTQPENWRTGLYECSKIFERFPSLEMVNIGGGFPVKYNGYVPNMQSTVEVIHEAISRYFKNRPYVAVEPGRFMVGNAALTAASVIQVKHCSHLSRAIVDISAFAGLIEIIESGNRFYYPTETDAAGELKPYRIGGSTCAGSDIIIDEVMLPELRADYRNPRASSRLYFLNTGAYTTDYVHLDAANGFNGAKIPKVYFMKNNEIADLK